jgi:hypothetical protein
MVKHAMVIIFVIGLLAGCQKSAAKPEEAATLKAPTIQYAEPPAINAGISVEQAYEAIPHRRTVWDDSDTTAPADERVYLRKIFEVLDEGVAIRVAGMQDYSAGHFDNSDPEAGYGQLLDYVEQMEAPKRLAAYHQDIVTALTGEQQFFADWKTQGENFTYAQNVSSDPGVKKASAALRSAYKELMAKYPHESPKNKDAFFDYHCALDFL